MADTANFIAFMMKAGVLTFGDFTTKSGRKTPYFINTGQYKTGAQISALGDFYADVIMESGVEFDALYGRRIRASPSSRPRRRRFTANTGGTSPTALTARRPKTTAKAASSSATSRRTATRSPSSKTS